MRKVIFVMAVTCMALFIQCEQQPEFILEIDFLGMPTNPGGLKSIPDCWDVPADYATIIVNGTVYNREIFYIDGRPYTQSIKFSEGFYTLEGFVLYFDQNNADPADDIPIAASPKSTGNYPEWVQTPLDIDFVVEGFNKVEIPVEVLCIGEKDVYANFGFDWFIIEEGSVRTQCFSGNLCVFEPADYTGSKYENQSQGLQPEMPAIFKIEVYRNDEFLTSYENMDWLGEDDPLCVMYLDKKNIDEKFDFELYVLVRYGKEGNSGHNHFNYKYIHTWTCWDDEEIPQGNNHQTDFSIGDCSPNADFILPPYIDLSKDCKSSITEFANSSPFTTGALGFLIMDITSIPDGHDFFNASWLAWSIDHESNIQVGTADNVNVYNSMYPGLFPEFVKAERWERLNWIMNHLDDYPDYEWSDIQGAFWLLDGWDGTGQYGVPDLSGLTHAQQMHDDALANAAGFVPGKEERVAIVMVPKGAQPAQQIVDIQVIFLELGI